MEFVKLKKLDGQEWDERKETRITFAQDADPQALRHLLNLYWTWHFDESLAETVRILLAADLEWERRPNLTTPPVGEVISPLGHALDHEEEKIRDAALQVLDSMVEIPAGEVLIGEELEPLWVDAFQIGRYPVTNAQYQRFIRETGHQPPNSWEGGTYPEKKGDHPVAWVNCEDVDAYAAWSDCRLPTFEEWQRAVRGDDAWLFPWGDEIDKPRCNTAELGAGGTTPVGAFPEGQSLFGCYDMLGNLWEWTSTLYDDKNPHFRVVRGGAWYYNHEHSTCISYDFFSKEYAEFVVGFRMAQ